MLDPVKSGIADLPAIAVTKRFHRSAQFFNALPDSGSRIGSGSLGSTKSLTHQEK
jgi:hypothetical protein